MIIDVVMPKMGESITEGTILEWRKKSGDPIKKDEILLEIGTDKVDSEIPSTHIGIIIELLAEPNDVIEVGKVIARIESEGKPGTQKVEETKDETTDIEEPLPEKIEVKEKVKILEKKEKPVERHARSACTSLLTAQCGNAWLSVASQMGGKWDQP